MFFNISYDDKSVCESSLFLQNNPEKKPLCSERGMNHNAFLSSVSRGSHDGHGQREQENDSDNR